VPLSVLRRPTEQAHVALGFRGLSRRDPDRWALAVCNQVLGGGTSSRLFQEVREERGLAYSVYSYVSQYADAGQVALYLGTRAENVREATDVVGAELARLLEEGLIAQTETGPRNSRTYALTEDGLEEIRRWLSETEPDRRVRSDALLRTFFLWLLEPADTRALLEREQAYWQGLLDELQAIRRAPRGTSRKEHAFLLALEGGISTVETRLEWLAWALGEVSSGRWRAADATPESAPSPV
jgi:predicted Zn-dependent peptidase